HEGVRRGAAEADRLRLVPSGRPVPRGRGQGDREEGGLGPPAGSRRAGVGREVNAPGGRGAVLPPPEPPLPLRASVTGGLIRLAGAGLPDADEADGCARSVGVERTQPPDPAAGCGGAPRTPSSSAEAPRAEQSLATVAQVGPRR